MIKTPKRIKENNVRLGQLLCIKVNESIKDRLIKMQHISPEDDERIRTLNDSIMLDRIWNMEDEEFLKFIFN